MKIFKRSYKILSLLLVFCMVTSFLPTVSFAAITYQSRRTGSETFSVSGAANSFAITTKEGFGGKLSSDTVYVYNPSETHTCNSGKNYLTIKNSILTGTVAEFNLLLEDESAVLNFMGGFINQTGYDDYLETGTMDTTSGNGHYTVLEKLISFSAAGVVVDPDKKSDVATATLADSLEVGVWHTIAIKTPGLVNGAGESEFLICINGKEFTIPTAEPYYGSRHIRLYGIGNKYIDNLMVYKSDALSENADFKNYSLIPSLTGESDAFALENKTITLYDSVTAGDLKAALSGADVIRVYTDSAYTTELADNEYLSAGNKVVAVSKNGDEIERGYSYYAVDTFTYTEDGLYDGADDISLKSGATVTNEDGTTTTLTPTIEKVDGVFGKVASDKVYKITPAGPTYNAGYNFLTGQSGLNTAVTELSLAMPESMSFGLQMSFYLDSEKSDSVTYAHFMRIEDGVIKTGTADTILAEASRGVTLGTIAPGEWVNIAIVVPGYNSFDATEEYSNKVVYIYVNGVKNEITLLQDIYGTKHLRFAPLSGDVFYYDNIRKYTSATEIYDAKKDAAPVVDFDTLKVSGDTILTDEGITVADLKDKLTTSATVRVFEDSTYAKELEDSDEVPFGAKVVFAATNKRTTERAYSYYTTGEMTYEEPDLYEGTKDLSLGANADGVRPTVNKIDGIYGKASTDTVYEVTVNGGSYSTGYNFLTLDIGKYTLETTVAEFSVLNKNGVTLSLESSFFTSASATDKITVTDETTGESSSVSNTNKGVLLQITDGKVKAGTTSSYFAGGYSGKVLGDAANDEWVNIAIVVPGYNSFDSTENYDNKTVYVYVNGVKNELVLSKDIYGVRHLRLAPGGSTGDVKTFYYDNIRKYLGNTESYDAKKDAQPVVDLSNIDVLDGNINVAKGTTVADFKEMLNTKATVRVFKTSDYDVLLSDADEMSRGNMVVFAASNSRTTERTYTYYTVNNPLSVSNIKLTNADGKIIRGTQTDIANIGEDYYLETTITNKATEQTVSLLAIAASYDSTGKMVDFDIADVTAAPGETKIDADTNPVVFKDVQTPEGGTLKGFLWTAASNEPLCEEFSALFDGTEEYHILAFSNSYGNDSFRNLPAIGKAAGIDIYAVNMYTGGCTLAKHYGYMNGSGTYESKVEYTPDGTITTKNATFQDGLFAHGYSWDYITLQSRSLQSYDFDYYYTESTPYITALADYIREGSPKSEVLFFQTWALDTDTAKSSTAMYDASEGISIAEAVADMEDSEIRPFLFSAIKANYTKAAETIGNPNRIIPVGEAINYAIGTLGFPEWTKKDDGSYDSSAAGRGIYRDTTCHLATTGQVLDSLVWYEYLTGHDARENPYQHSGISEEDMALLKQAAHWACTQADYIKAK